MSNAQWSDDRVQSLAKLWADGLSASQIARQLGGVTRNAVIGKIHRLGLSGRAAPSRPARAPKTPRAARPRALAPPPLGERAAAPEAPAPSSAPSSARRLREPGLVGDMLHLAAHACKMPIGDPKDDAFSFCGRPTAGDGPYCPSCRTLAYRARPAAPLHRDPKVRRVLAGLAA